MSAEIKRTYDFLSSKLSQTHAGNDPMARLNAPTGAGNLPGYLQSVSFTAPGSSAPPMMGAPPSEAGFAPTTIAQPPWSKAPTFDANEAMKMYYEQQRRRWAHYSLGGYGTVGSEDATAGGTFNSGAW